MREAPQYAHAPYKLTFDILTFDLLTLKVVSESRVTWGTSVPILVFLGLAVLDFGPMYACGRLVGQLVIPRIVAKQCVLGPNLSRKQQETIPEPVHSNNSKLLAGGRHDMPPPLSSLCGRLSA